MNIVSIKKTKMHTKMNILVNYKVMNLKIIKSCHKMDNIIIICYKKLDNR